MHRLGDPSLGCHLSVAHNLWKRIIRPGDFVIDATCGNGRDSLCLAQAALQGKGSLWICDVQEIALERTWKRLRESLSEEQLKDVRAIQGCHSSLEPDREVRLVTYNLGYLPGGNKQLTTNCKTTLASVRRLLPFLGLGGLISLTCYPGHEEGAREQEALLRYAQGLTPEQWIVSHTRWLNRARSPTLLLIQRKARGVHDKEASAHN